MLKPPVDGQHVYCRRTPYFDPPWPAYYQQSSGTYTPEMADGSAAPDYLVHSWRPYP